MKVSDDLKKGKYKSLSKGETKNYAKCANDEIERRKEVRKDKRINIRLTKEDLENLKKKAQKEGLPYQSLVTSVLHKYLIGALVDLNNVKAIKRALRG